MSSLRFRHRRELPGVVNFHMHDSPKHILKPPKKALSMAPDRPSSDGEKPITVMTPAMKVFVIGQSPLFSFASC